MDVNIENVQNEETEEQRDPMIILENALTICKFGKFHIRLFFASFCGIMASFAVTTTSSFILPFAECDLQMDMLRKGWLNSMPFFGQIGAGLFIGFLVDTFGRRIFLLAGNLGIFLCALLEGSSQTYGMLVTVKLLQGVGMSLSFNIISTMLSEFVHKEIRDRALLLLGGFMSLAVVILSLTAWGTLPQTQWHFVISKGYFEIHSWNIYLYVCSIWSLLALIVYYSLPESPKFLLSNGQKEKALEVLQQIYHENTGNDKNTFPIKTLEFEVTPKYEKTLNLKKQIVKSMFEVKHLFNRVIVYRLMIICLMTFICLSTFTCLRLWYPQISTTVEHYYQDHGHSAPFCEMIKYKSTPNISTEETTICEPQISGSETYINNIMLGVASLVFVSIATIAVEFVGHRQLIFIVQVSAATCAGALYYTNSSIQIAVLISAICSFVQANGALQSNIIVRIFPTKLRALAFSIVMIVGRIGSLLGNILFPVLLRMGCMAPFLTLSVASLCQACVVYFLPDPKKQNKSGDK